MKNIILLLVLGFTLNLGAQEKKIIKKRVESRTSEVRDNDIKSKVKFKIMKEIVNGEEVTSYTLEEVIDGQKKIIQWDGEGDMPPEIKAQLEKSKNVDESSEEINITRIKKYVVEVEENGEKKVMKWDGAGEMPEEMKEKMEEHDIEIEVDEDGHTTKTIMLKSDHSSKYEVKVRMGIGLNPSAEGVKVEYVEDDSPASKAGIKSNDIVLKINSAYIFTNETLMKELAKYNPGDKVKVTIIRDSKEMTTEMTLEAK